MAWIFGYNFKKLRIAWQSTLPLEELTGKPCVTAAVFLAYPCEWSPADGGIGRFQGLQGLKILSPCNPSVWKGHFPSCKMANDMLIQRYLTLWSAKEEK
jgi:hypothetical protein